MTLLRKLPRSIEARLAISIGALLTVLWIGAAYVTALIVRDEMNEVFDSTLHDAAQRLLPLAVMDIIGRDEDGVTQKLSAIRAHDEFFTYIVRDEDDRILLQSHAANPDDFPPWAGPGFGRTATHRLYSDAALQGSVRITVAEPLEHRREVAREVQMGLGLPLLLVIPIALGAVIVAVRISFAPLRRFREGLAARGPQVLSPVPAEDLPAEIAPMAATLNGLLDRLKAAFDAERTFAANAAHELRTPLAGAIAQAQRLQGESADPAVRKRAADIETTLKRLTRLAGRLIELARAEGGRLRLDRTSDLRIVTRLVADDAGRTVAPGRIALRLPERPVVSDLDPDAFGILCRNLVDNALRHGAAASPVEVTLRPDGMLIVANDGPVVPPEVLQRLTGRFVRAGGDADGSGLGLAIVAAIASRIGSALVLRSPRPGAAGGFEASVKVPATDHGGSMDAGVPRDDLM